jgi:hypothetical protein
VQLPSRPQQHDRLSGPAGARGSQPQVGGALEPVDVEVHALDPQLQRRRSAHQRYGVCAGLPQHLAHLLDSGTESSDDVREPFGGPHQPGEFLPRDAATGMDDQRRQHPPSGSRGPDVPSGPTPLDRQLAECADPDAHRRTGAQPVVGDLATPDRTPQPSQTQLQVPGSRTLVEVVGPTYEAELGP